MIHFMLGSLNIKKGQSITSEDPVQNLLDVYHDYQLVGS